VFRYFHAHTCSEKKRQWTKPPVKLSKSPNQSPTLREEISEILGTDSNFDSFSESDSDSESDVLIDIEESQSDFRVKKVRGGGRGEGRGGRRREEGECRGEVEVGAVEGGGDGGR
jgi:hypothetical protein